MTELDNIFVGGDWIPSASTERLQVESPTTEEIIGSVPDSGEADMDAAVAAAKGAFASWSRTPADERIEILSRVSQNLQAKATDMAAIISDEVGTPPGASLMMQVFASTMVLDNYVNAAKNFPWVEQRQGSLGQKVMVHRHPVGVTAGIVPWNVPLFIACMKLGPVLATGSTMVLKASPETPLHTALLAECLAEAGVPAGVVNIVAAGPAGSEYLVRHPDIDKVSFTGSVATGGRVGAICGEQIKRCTLELGGKSAAIILDDVDLDASMGDLVMSGMLNSGQACGAQTRLLAPASRYDEIAEALGEAVGNLKVGGGDDAEAELGPLVSSNQRDKVLNYIASGKEQGATAIVGGGAGDFDKGYFVQPTVFRDVTNDMTIAQEEIFGPVLSLIKYDDVAEAIDIANDSDFGLSGSVWTTDLDRAAEVGAQVRTGVVAVNSSAILDMASPFGGFKKSGIGRELGPEGIAQLTEIQSILLPAGS